MSTRYDDSLATFYSRTVSNGAEGETPNATGSSGDGAGQYLVRVASVFLVAQNRNVKPKEIVDRLLKELGDDARVLEVSPPMSLEMFEWNSCYPDASRTRRDALSDETDMMHVFRFGDAIRFSISVPIKNQPIIYGVADIPASTYACEWDGMVLVVGWLQTDPDIPISGGHVAFDVLKDVSAKAGFATYLQGCTPGCEGGFLHQTISVIEDPSESSRIERQAGNDRVVLYAPSAVDLTDAVDEVGFAVRLAVGDFALFKNAVRRMLDLDKHSHHAVWHMLELNYLARKAASAPWYKWLLELWHNRGWRRQVRSYAAQAWLAVNSMQRFASQAAESMHALDYDHRDIAVLFEGDYANDRAKLKQFDPARIVGAVQQASVALDTRILVVATILGAMGGGAAGAAISLLQGLQ